MPAHAASSGRRGRTHAPPMSAIACWGGKCLGCVDWSLPMEPEGKYASSRTPGTPSSSVHGAPFVVVVCCRGDAWELG